MKDASARWLAWLC